MLILNDNDVDSLTNMTAAISSVRAAFVGPNAEKFVASPRNHVSFPGRGDLVFTTGGIPEGPVGFRVYDTFSGGSSSTQLIVVWNAVTGVLDGIVVGQRVGKMRNGAIGGLAIRAMSREDAKVVGVLGSGAQARTQLEAAATVRSLKEVRVFSRNANGRELFAREMTSGLGVNVHAVESARAAVEGAEIIICATKSIEPVFDANWVMPGAHVNTVGPKIAGAHELPLGVAAAATIIATDSITQVEAMSRPFFLEDTPMRARLAPLGDILDGVVVGRSGRDDITVFCLTGLAGTEVLIAADTIARAEDKI